MHLKLGTEENNRKVAIISHRNTSLSCTLRFISKDNIDLDYDIFEQINLYWKELSLEKQDEIFFKYEKIYADFQEAAVSNIDLAKTKNVITELLDSYDLDDVRRWVLFSGKIKLPSEDKIPVTYERTIDHTGSKEQTYLQEDFIKLIVLTIIAKSMLPIWGDYIYIYGKELGTDYKENAAFKLMSDSKIFEYDAITKLHEYIEKSIEQENNITQIINAGMSTEMFPKWVMSLIVVRRLTIADIRGLDPNNTLITFIYKFMAGKVRGDDTNSSTIRAKNFNDDTGSSDSSDNLSRIESFRLPLQLSAGDIVSLGMDIHDPFRCLKMIDPLASESVLEEALVTSKQLQTNPINKAQLILAQWVCGKKMSPRSIPYFDNIQLSKLLAVVQTVLFNKKYFFLGGIATAMTTTNILNITSSDAKARITKEQLEILDKIYPYPRKNTKARTIRVNPAVEAIDEYVKEITEFQWVMTVAQKYLQQCNNGLNNRRVSIPQNIKPMLANLIIDIDTF